MNAAILAAQSTPSRDRQDDMKSPLVASLIMHAFLVALFSGAFFFFSKPIEIPEEAMAVEILNVAEKASSDIDAPVAKKMPKEPEKVSEEPPPMPKATEMPKPLKSETSKPSEKVEAEKFEEIRPQEKPKPEKKAEVAEKKAEAKPKKPPEKKPPAEAKKEESKEKPKEEESEEQFSSVLKNLVGDEEAQPTPDSVARDTPRQAPQLTAPAPLGSTISMSEMDALRAQLAQCWNIVPGARDAQDLIVDIEVTVSQARTVIDAKVVDQLRYNSDSFFRAAADSALRALRAPACTPLALPEAKYDQWKNMTVRFDPKNMF